MGFALDPCAGSIFQSLNRNFWAWVHCWKMEMKSNKSSPSTPSNMDRYTSNVCQIISVMKTKTLFQRNDISKIVNFGILIHIVFLKRYSRLLRKKTQSELQQSFDRIIEVAIIWRSRRTRLLYLIFFQTVKVEANSSLTCFFLYSVCEINLVRI